MQRQKGKGTLRPPSEATNSHLLAGQLEKPVGPRPCPSLPASTHFPRDASPRTQWHCCAGRLRVGPTMKRKRKAPAGLRPSHR